MDGWMMRKMARIKPSVWEFDWNDDADGAASGSTRETELHFTPNDE
jgi:hypothetical protein